MFSDNIVSEQQGASQRQRLTKYQGVDLSSHQCYELKWDLALDSYERSTLHYAIDAMQKGLKLPTKVGLKRLAKKNDKTAKKDGKKGKRIRKTKLMLNKRSDPKVYYQDKDNQNLNPESGLVEQKKANIKPLNPLSPEEVCLKSLRTQLRQEIIKQREKTFSLSQLLNVRSLERKISQTKQQKDAHRKPKFIRKKQNQLRRRIQLIHLVDENYEVLRKIFGPQILKPTSYGLRAKCPQISRELIREALTKYYEQLQGGQEIISELNDREKIEKMIDEKMKERSDAATKMAEESKKLIEQRQQKRAERLKYLLSQTQAQQQW